MLLTAEGLTKRFGGVSALADVAAIVGVDCEPAAPEIGALSV